MCVSNRRYRFLKEPKGILPTIIQNLLDARKIQELKLKITNQDGIVNDKRKQV